MRSGGLKKKQKRKNIYPKTFITAAKLTVLANHGVDLKIDDAELVSTLYTADGKPVKVFGSGYKTNIDISGLFDKIGVSTSAGEKLFYKGENDG